MATLVSPGVSVSVVDESNYVPAPGGTVPLVVFATAQDKTSGTGTGIAAGTTADAAGNVYLITSQRDLTATFGNPLFYQDSAGTPLHGYEINEFGLMAAFSVLGISNRCYCVRADIDLAQLEGTSSRPLGAPDTGTYWLDTSADSLWGIFEWNQSTGLFTNKVPTVITSTDDLTGGVPSASVGSVGSYAIVATNVNNPLYYKGTDGAWVLVGSTAWQQIVPAIQSDASPTTTPADAFTINGTLVTLTGTTATSAASDINSATISGISAGVVNNRLEIYVTDASSSDGSTLDGAAFIANSVNTPLTDLGITVGTYAAADLAQAAHTSVPEWKSTDTSPRPTGSVWVKTTTPNSGADLEVSVYNATSSSWTVIDAPLYENDQTANQQLDNANGGENIASGALYTQFDVSEDDTATYKLFERSSVGDTTITGTLTTATITAADQFTLSESAPGSTAMSTPVTVTTTGTTLASLASDISAAGLTYVSASIASSGALVITHSQGGVIIAADTSGTPLADAGINTTIEQVRAGNNSDLIISNWVALTYTAGVGAPSTDPVNNINWYDSSTDVDIMIHDGTNWRGYQNVTNDARGFDLSNTDPAGVIVSASEPTTQSDATALVVGDLWLDSGDLENWPVLYRYQSVNGENTWVQIDNTDQTTENGVIFADARYMGDTTTDVVTGTVTDVANLLTSDVVDIDRPDPTLYPRGVLLFNTRRSGGTVKQFRADYFSRTNFSDTSVYPTLPTEKDAWVSVSGNKNDGSPYMRRKAQRAVIVEALQAAMDNNEIIREEQREFNLIAAPGYPELIDNMVVLNNDRKGTGFVVGDAPMRLAANATDIQNWAQNAAGATMGEDGLTVNDEYTAIYYPAGSTNDLSGNAIVVPPSHMALRTIIRSDEVSYPWLAPAGTRRGIIDNADGLGYIDTESGEFVTTSIREGIRDTMYENSLNPLTFIVGSGLMVYGQRTRASSATALDRVNVARLVAYLRKQLDELAKPFVFEPNDKITRDEIKQLVEQTMNDLIAKRAIFDYLVVCDESNNTPTRIDRNELYVDVAIEPVKAAEFIYIPIRLQNTGEISGL